jgi:hypothetical protein
MENEEHALGHLCSSECRLDLPNDKGSSKAGSGNSAVLFFGPRVHRTQANGLSSIYINTPRQVVEAYV